ncbi:hypothetical protein D3C85_1652310 [compost metagenome]
MAGSWMPCGTSSLLNRGMLRCVYVGTSSVSKLSLWAPWTVDRVFPSRLRFVSKRGTKGEMRS